MNCRNLSLAGAAAVLCWICAAPALSAEPEVAVHYGGEADLDACGSSGAVTGLRRDGDNFLAVRSGPAVTYRMLDKLLEDQSVQICDERGSWLGIVYGEAGQDCGTGSPVAKRQPYRGRCKSGWVSSKYIRLLAG